MKFIGAMLQTITGSRQTRGLKKTTINLFLFFASFIVVLAILTWGKNLNRQAFAGTLIISAASFLILYFFLLQFRRELLLVTRKVFFILLAIIGFVAITKIVTGLPGRDMVFIIPFAIITIIIRTFYDARLALFILLITIMLAGFMVPQPFEFVFLSFVSGMAAIFTLKTVYRKTRLFLTVLVVVVTYTGLWMGICLMEKGKLPDDFSHSLLLFAINGFLILVSFPLVFLFEQNFLLLSETTLNELSDINQPLLRKFAEEAPGSFQHSLQVSNLAEEAARIIGANHLLVRAGALYHDIGKIGNPRYFVENQSDEMSPHEKLDPKDSARIIISHVQNGVNLAKNYKMPVQIIDFIRMHHGTTVAYFFFKKYLDQNPDEAGLEIIEKTFKYPGPKPFSKETAVVMMADAIEASSRSIAAYSEDSISELVERIIFIQEQDGQFSDVPLTFKDLSDIKNVLKKRLATIYHARIAYPERI
ncbi:MAG: HDIG domain-containing protein [Bacteroidia bacterium]|nr:HDIG domain-containing protein [Bacteroidia bacterium]